MIFQVESGSDSLRRSCSLKEASAQRIKFIRQNKNSTLTWKSKTSLKQMWKLSWVKNIPVGTFFEGRDENLWLRMASPDSPHLLFEDIRVVNLNNYHTSLLQARGAYTSQVLSSFRLGVLRVVCVTNQMYKRTFIRLTTLCRDFCRVSPQKGFEGTKYLLFP